MRNAFRTVVIVAAALLAAQPALAQNVGTAAAVNPSASGAVPSGGIRTITLGSSIVHNERITTGEVGLVQVLFLDGTTLTLGPRSELVIDSFFYDPNAAGGGAAQLAATMTKGTLRFIGGLTSKTPDGANIATPIGTVGIRGAITDIVLGGPNQRISMSFGSEVTLTQGLELIGRLYEAGYSLVVDGSGSISVIKTPPEWTNEIAQALAGRPGTSGGSSSRPTDQTVADSGVPGGNSGNNANLPGSTIPLTDQEIAQLLAAIAAYDELREFIVTQPPQEEPRPTTTRYGASGGMVHIRNYNTAGDVFLERQVPTVTTGMDLASAVLTSITIDDETGLPVAGVIDVTTPTISECTDCRFTISIDGDTATATAIDASGTYPNIEVTANLYDHTQVSLPGGVDYCICAFLNWGFWDLDSDRIPAPDGTSIHVTTNGAWVVGTPTSMADLATLGSLQEHTGTYATYNGHAAGFFSLGGGPQQLAAGDLYLEWSFADREGWMKITDFDDRDFVGTMYEASGGPAFSGSLGNDGSGTGSARGVFVNDGSTPAAGVGGDFWLEDDGWRAGGVFVGARGDDGFPH